MIRAIQSLLAWLIFVIVISGAVHIGTILFLPNFLMEAAMSRVSSAGGLNTTIHPPPVDETSRTIIKPSPDLLYSSCVFNLTQEDLRLTASVPATGYWSLSLFDVDTNTFLVRNNKAGAAKIDFVLTGPGGRLDVPPGAELVQAPSFKGIIILRQLYDSSTSFEELDAVRRNFQCTPLPH